MSAGRNADPLYRIRKLLPTGTERLDERGTHRVLLGLRIDIDAEAPPRPW